MSSPVESAVASGRYVYITTYYDRAPNRAQLLFRTPEQATECARLLTSDVAQQERERDDARAGERLREHVRSCGADDTLQRDALMRWREMTGCDTPHAAREELDRLRRALADVGAGATDVARMTAEVDRLGKVAAAERALRKALSDLWNATTDRDDWKKSSACDRLRQAEASLLALGLKP